MYQDMPSLCETYADYFKIGAAVMPQNLTAQRNLIVKHFNSLTTSSAMKFEPIHPEEYRYDFADADAIFAFAKEHHMAVRAHAPVWHQQTADWIFTDRFVYADRELLLERLEDHIRVLAGRYGDSVYAWDVVNEAMDDGGPSAYRQSQLYKLYGDEFIAKAFKYAHEADPSALLFYNDYNASMPTKRDRIYNMVKKMQAAGVPITGIGMQGHCNIYGPSAQDVDAALTKYAELVSHIHITELDVRCNKEMGGQLQFSKGDTQQMTDSLAALQAAQYDRLFQVFRNHKDVIDNVTFWNLCDGDSWLGVNNHPLLFDEHLQPKRAYYKVKHFNPNN